MRCLRLLSLVCVALYAHTRANHPPLPLSRLLSARSLRPSALDIGIQTRVESIASHRVRIAYRSKPRLAASQSQSGKSPTRSITQFSNPTIRINHNGQSTPPLRSNRLLIRGPLKGINPDPRPRPHPRRLQNYFVPCSTRLGCHIITLARRPKSRQVAIQTTG